ncbi:MAG: glutamine-synthetase adenylyltransferase, partial [Bryobacteraceae bacterium]
GGIRDIEFLAQCLQRLHGGSTPWVQHRGTLLALARLQNTGLLSGAEYGNLASAYQFLRHLEHRLQFDEDLQTHTLPSEPEALELLARRMPGGGSAQWLMGELHRHFGQVLEIYERVIHSRTGPEMEPLASGRPAPFVMQALEQRAPELAAAVARADLHRGYHAFEYFLERLSRDPERLELLNSDPELADAALDLFEHSPFFGEELIRRPESIEELARAPVQLFRDEPPPRDAVELRRWFRRGMLRIEAESVCRSHPIFDTLARTSELADAVIARAYDLAVAEASATPLNDHQPRDRMWVIALGRLGLREFDLGSDADLMFVLADSEGAEIAFW